MSGIFPQTMIRFLLLLAGTLTGTLLFAGHIDVDRFGIELLLVRGALLFFGAIYNVVTLAQN